MFFCNVQIITAVAIHTVVDWLFLFCQYVFVVWTHAAIGSVVISRERFEHELCLPGWLSSDIIRGPILSENARHLCMWHQRIRRDSCQKILRFKTLHSQRTSSRPQFPLSTHETPWDHDPPLLATNMASILWLGLSYAARVKRHKVNNKTQHRHEK